MENADGWITIGTDLVTDKFEMKLKKFTNRLKKEETDLEVRYSEVQDAEKELREVAYLADQARKKQQEHLAILEKKKQQYESINALIRQGEPVSQEQYDRFGILSNDIVKLQEEQKDLNKVYDDYNSKVNKTTDLLDKSERKYQSQKDKVTALREEIQFLIDEESKRNAQNLSSTSISLDGIGNSISRITKKVVRWGLAIFGVRSAYMFVRQAMSTLAQYNDQLALDIQYIRFALATTLEPLIKAIVEWVYKILQYVNYLTMAWFNINLFAKATTSAFQKTNKEAKKLQKTLASFDEMNILNDNSNNNDSGLGSPSTDLSKMQDFKPPKWLVWIKENGDLIKKIIIGIGVALGAIKFAQLLKWASDLSGLLGGLATIGVIAIGVELLYTALTGRELISDIMEIKKGLKDLNKIRKEQDKQAKSSQERTKSLIKTYNETANSVGVTKEKTELYIDTLLNGIKTDEQLIENMEKQKNWLGVLNGDNKKLTETQKEYNKTIEIQLQELKKLYDKGELNNKQKATYQSLLEKQIAKLQTNNSTLSKNSEEYKKNTEKIKETKNELEKITGKTYNVKTSIQTPDTNPIKNKLRDLLNWITKNFNNNINIGFGFGSGGGMGFRAKGGIYYPKLASGGIINMPGRGVPYHGSIIGERGAEAVVPLTDSQQMALLGEAIGKYITVNATIVNSMNGRVLSKELQKVQSQAEFATNGRWY